MQHWPHPAWRSGAHVCYCADTQRLRRESPITDAISWTLDERPFGGRSRASASGETVWVSQTCCYNYHINHPRQHAHALLHKTCTFRNSELSDTFFRSTCERTYFCLAISAQGCVSWTVAGSAASRQSGKNEFGLFGATQKEKKKGRLAIYPRIIFNHGPFKRALL